MNCLLFLYSSLTLSVYAAAVTRSRSHIQRPYCQLVFPSIIVTSNDNNFPSSRKDMKLFYYKRENENMGHSPSYISNGSPSKPTLKRKKLQESDDRSLLEQMRKSLGETEDVFEDAESESKQLLQG